MAGGGILMGVLRGRVWFSSKEKDRKNGSNMVARGMALNLGLVFGCPQT